MKYIVDVNWAVARSFDIEADTQDEAEDKMWKRIRSGDVCVFTDRFEATDDVEVHCSGEMDENGNKNYYE